MQMGDTRAQNGGGVCGLGLLRRHLAADVRLLTDAIARPGGIEVEPEEEGGALWVSAALRHRG